MLRGATVKRDVWLSEATVIGNVSFDYAEIKGGVFADGAVLEGGVSLDTATVEGPVTLSVATVTADVFLGWARVNDEFVLAPVSPGTRLKRLSLSQAELMQWSYLDVTAERVDLSRARLLRGLTARVGEVEVVMD